MKIATNEQASELASKECKPCPHCGAATTPGNPLDGGPYLASALGSECAVVTCGDCGLRGPVPRGSLKGNYPGDRHRSSVVEAIRLWNDLPRREKMPLDEVIKEMSFFLFGSTASVEIYENAANWTVVKASDGEPVVRPNLVDALKVWANARVALRDAT